MEHDIISTVLDWTSIDEWLAENPGKVGRRKVYEWVNAGLIPHVRHGRAILIPSNLLHVAARAQAMQRQEQREAA